VALDQGIRDHRILTRRFWYANSQSQLLLGYPTGKAQSTVVCPHNTSLLIIKFNLYFDSSFFTALESKCIHKQTRCDKTTLLQQKTIMIMRGGRAGGGKGVSPASQPIKCPTDFAPAVPTDGE
jgi:hypothetical protein